MIDLVRLDLKQNLDHASEIIEGDRFQTHLVADSKSLEIDERGNLSVPRGAADAVLPVQEQLCKIGSVLSRDSGNYDFFHFILRLGRQCAPCRYLIFCNSYN